MTSCRVPGECAAGSRLLKRDGRSSGLSAQPVAARAGREIDQPFLEMGIAVLAGPKPNTSNHDRAPRLPQAQLPKVRDRCPSPNARSLPQPHSDQPHPLQTSMPVLTDDDVVVHGNAEQRGNVDDRPGHPDVGLRRRRVAGGVIVHEASTSNITLNTRCFLHALQ